MGLGVGEVRAGWVPSRAGCWASLLVWHSHLWAPSWLSPAVPTIQRLLPASETREFSAQTLPKLTQGAMGARAGSGLGMGERMGADGAWKSCSDSIPTSFGAVQGRAEEPGKVFPARPAPQGGISPWTGHISLGVRVSTKDTIQGVSGCLGSSVSAPPRPKRRRSWPQSMWNISLGPRADREPLPLHPTPHFGVSRGLFLLYAMPGPPCPGKGPKLGEPRVSWGGRISARDPRDPRDPGPRNLLLSCLNLLIGPQIPPLLQPPGGRGDTIPQGNQGEEDGERDWGLELFHSSPSHFSVLAWELLLQKPHSEGGVKLPRCHRPAPATLTLFLHPNGWS